MTQELPGLGRALVLFGSLIVVAGLLLMAGPKLPWLGRLPGDIHIQREGFSFFFPLTSCLVVSAAISLVAWIVRRVR
ncbi:MAG: DUF2905 domain-containing protein [Dehalococcoidia bacterium]|nr:DUF2905 domain-containing protein [Dehalococcoidia bacterium]